MLKRLVHIAKLPSWLVAGAAAGLALTVPATDFVFTRYSR